MRALTLLLPALVAAPSLGAQSITLLGYKATPPAAWVARTPSSSSRLAQFTVPGADAASGAEVVVFFFGTAGGGNVQANLERWRGQFSTPDGSPVPEKVTRDSSGAFPVTVAEYRGTYRRGVGMGSTDSVKTGQAMATAIVETPKGTMFVQMFGAAARVDAERRAFLAFVKGIR